MHQGHIRIPESMRLPFVYGARDEQHNGAVVLRDVIEDACARTRAEHADRDEQ